MFNTTQSEQEKIDKIKVDCGTTLEFIKILHYFLFFIAHDTKNSKIEFRLHFLPNNNCEFLVTDCVESKKDIEKSFSLILKLYSPSLIERWKSPFANLHFSQKKSEQYFITARERISGRTWLEETLIKRGMEKAQVCHILTQIVEY